MIVFIMMLIIELVSNDDVVLIIMLIAGKMGRKTIKAGEQFDVKAEYEKMQRQLIFGIQDL